MEAAQIYRWCELGSAALRQGEAAINSLNVFPIADADTGTNLMITWDEAARAALAARDGNPGPDEASSALNAMAQAATLVAMGSSGMILSQWLTGYAGGVTGSNTAAGIAAGLVEANRAAWTAVADPVAGTMLTVSAAIARAAEAENEPLSAALAAASSALSATADQLPADVRTGEVDAGALGLVLLLEALAGAVEPGAPSPTLESVVAMVVDAPDSEAWPEDSDRYEVQYLLQLTDTDRAGSAEPPVVARLRSELAELGDSIVIGGAGDWSEDPAPLCHVHVHVDAADVTAALGVGAAVGELDQVRVTPLVEKL